MCYACYGRVVESISHREMRNNSGSILRRVAAGESLLVTNDGVPAALLVPVPTSPLEQLIAQGEVAPSSVPFDVDALPPPVTSSVPTEQIIDDDRGDH